MVADLEAFVHKDRRIQEVFQEAANQFSVGKESAYQIFTKNKLGMSKVSAWWVPITKTCLYDIDPLKPHFYIVKLGFTGVYAIFLIFAQKHKLWVLVRTASPRRF